MANKDNQAFLKIGTDFSKLQTKYDIADIPPIVVIKPNGDVITKNGRADVSVSKSWDANIIYLRRENVNSLSTRLSKNMLLKALRNKDSWEINLWVLGNGLKFVWRFDFTVLE